MTAWFYFKEEFEVRFWTFNLTFVLLQTKKKNDEQAQLY